jgi:hypothetical protein
VEDPIAEKRLRAPDQGFRCKVTEEDGKLTFEDEETYSIVKAEKRELTPSGPKS